MFTALEIMRNSGNWGMGGWWMWVGMAIFWVLILGLLFGVLGRRWRRSAWEHAEFQGGGYSSHAGRSAEVTLAERFAQGDIDEKEYRGRLEVLRANAPTRRK